MLDVRALLTGDTSLGDAETAGAGTGVKLGVGSGVGLREARRVDGGVAATEARGADTGGETVGSDARVTATPTPPTDVAASPSTASSTTFEVDVWRRCRDPVAGRWCRPGVTDQPFPGPGARSTLDPSVEECPDLRFAEPPVSAGGADAGDPTGRRPSGDRFRVHTEQCGDFPRGEQTIR